MVQEFKKELNTETKRNQNSLTKQLFHLSLFTISEVLNTEEIIDLRFAINHK